MPLYRLTLPLFLSCIFLTQNLKAKPEYAIDTKTNKCTTCHVSPAGGGIKNMVGKAFASSGFTPTPFTAKDLFSLDAKWIYVSPEKPSKQRGGLGLMSNIVSANIPLNQDAPTRNHMIIGYNFGGFKPTETASSWETYLKSQRYSDNTWSFWPQYMMLGRFHLPFGHMSDRHRSLLKMQTASDWLRLSTGLLFSADPTNFLHYDLAIVSGGGPFGGSPKELDEGGAGQIGAALHLRFLLADLPGFLGTSINHRTRGKSPMDGENHMDASAYSIYLHLKLDKLTKNILKGSIITEGVLARGFNNKKYNPSLAGFVNNDFLDALKDKESQGYALEWKEPLTSQIKASLIYEFLALDKNTTGDAYKKTAIEIEYRIDAAMRLSLMHENMATKNLYEKDEASKAKRDITSLIYHIAI